MATAWRAERQSALSHAGVQTRTLQGSARLPHVERRQGPAVSIDHERLPVGGRLNLKPAEGCWGAADRPLHTRVPTRDARGRPVSDFMMLFPGLRERRHAEIADRVEGLGKLLGSYEEVLFADLNLPLNLLWVSVRPIPGAISMLVAAIQQRFPEALLVAPDTRSL